MENNQLTTVKSSVSDTELLMHLDNLGLTSKLNEGEKNTYLQIAKAFNLNPFKREIHVSKYGTGEYAKMSIITGYEVYIKRAERSGQLDGWDVKTEGKTEDDSLKAIITIYRKDRKYPFTHEVMYSEYVQKTKEGKVTQFWEKAFTMIKKVAISQGFRLCFSDELGGMPYTTEEMPEQNQTIDTTHVEIKNDSNKEVISIHATQLEPLSDSKFKAMCDAIANGKGESVRAKMNNYTLLFKQKEELEKLLNENQTA